MTLSLFTLAALAASGFFAGGLGALVGIGGGVVLVPLLVLGFGVDIRLAVATSLVCVVATSTAAGSVYVGKGLTHMRLAMTLEIFTTLGGISGGLISALVPERILSALFAALMVLTAVLTLRNRETHKRTPSGGTAQAGHEERGRLAGSYFDAQQGALVHYEVARVPLGAAISCGAGVVSGLLGVGGGFIKVPAMNLGMRVPIKVAAATSNFMIGVTAASSLFVYFARGAVQPLLVAPVALGVVGGARVGAAMARRVSPGNVRRVLALVVGVVAIQMALAALGVKLAH